MHAHILYLLCVGGFSPPENLQNKDLKKGHCWNSPEMCCLGLQQLLRLLADSFLFFFEVLKWSPLFYDPTA